MAYAPGSGSLDDDLKHAQMRRLEIENARPEKSIYPAGYGTIIPPPPNYAGGGPVYKNSHPTAIAFGKSGDSKLLAKSRGAKD
jgi:hypothetical protein